MERNKDLRLLKTSLKIRKQTLKSSDSKAASTKVDSPIAKYDSAGNLTCIICRINIKSSNVWKVHINSKQHKRSLELAKQKGIDNTAESTPSNAKEAAKQSSIKAVPKANAQNEEPVMKVARLCEQSQVAVATAPASTTEILPEKFFDKEKTSTNGTTDRNQDEEWVRFQREIKDAAAASSIIIAEEQDNVNIKRQLKEIDEQIENWQRFMKINEKKNSLLKKQRPLLAKVHQESDSSGDESTEENIGDWRAKSLQK